MMFRSLIAVAIATCLALPSSAANYTVAVPEALPGGADTVKPDLWSIFVETLGPDDRYQVLNATTPGLVASIDIPDEAKYTRARWRAKDFKHENARIAAHLDAMADGPPQIDLMGSLRHVALNRRDPETPIDLLFIGSVVQRFEEEPAFAMAKGDTLFVPSPAHLSASVAETPYGIGSEGDAGLANVFVHLCPVGDDLSSDAEAAYQRFYGAYIAARGGKLVTWSANLPTCFERFKAGVRTPINVAPYGDDDGKLAMLDISRSPVVVAKTEPTTVIVNGVAVEQFNLFSDKPHPTLSGVEVTTGVVYVPGNYPDKYERAYCYFNIWKNGANIRLDLGDKRFERGVVWNQGTASALRSVGVSRRDFEAGRSACQWPTI